MNYTEKLISIIANKNSIDISKFDMKELVMGMEVELEHGSINPDTDITGDDPEATLKIVMAHINEFSDYYTRLKNMENKKEKITEYARRMRELAGFSEGKQNKSIKTIQEGESPFDKGQTFYAKDMMAYKDENIDISVNVYEDSYPFINSKESGIEFDSLDSAKKWAKEKIEGQRRYRKSSGELWATFLSNGEEIKGERISENEIDSIKEDKEFETHKFEQKSIEDGEDDKELYTLNENTIIVLDFLDDNND